VYGTGRGFKVPARSQTFALGTRRGTRLRRRDAADKPTFDFADLCADRQTVTHNQKDIRTTNISSGESVVTSYLSYTATFYIGRLEKCKTVQDPTFLLTVDSDSSTKNNGRLETSRELSNS
jgi:hypothetical protein